MKTAAARYVDRTGDFARQWQTIPVGIVHVRNGFQQQLCIGMHGARGGQGAPLAPIYHQALLQHGATHEKLGNNTAVLNLGGVANLTWWDGEAELIAFDTGPANAPVNDWIAQYTSEVMDIDGKQAAAGRVDEQRLAELLQHPYLSAAFPKSLDRFDFASSMADGLNLQDGAALLTAFSAAVVSKVWICFPIDPTP
ncbi:MAG: anhydro-N-acetylmuramic acid kinase [Granulosicoccus sp.]